MWMFRAKVAEATTAPDLGSKNHLLMEMDKKLMTAETVEKCDEFVRCRPRNRTHTDGEASLYMTDRDSLSVYEKHTGHFINPFSLQSGHWAI
ncbi:hypothetical protein Mapa_015431 [Marchantia paleacea]|nr:hypothetical protein Mapa_015431 [Marchantia paleacea]